MIKSIISIIGRTTVREMLEATAVKAAKKNDEVGGPRANRANGRTVITPGKSIKPTDPRPATAQRARK